MWSLLATAGLVIGVYFGRLTIQRHIQGIARLIGFSPKGGLYVYTLVFFPGIIIHEIAHFLMAAILGLRTGEIHLWPKEINDNKGGETVLGSVQVAKTDPVRASLVGAAPFLAGTLSIYYIVMTRLNWTEWQPGLMVPDWVSFAWLYLIFVMANTMFSSKEDTRSWPLLAIGLLILIILGWLTGLLGGVMTVLMPWITQAATAMLRAYAVVLVLDGLVIAVLLLVEKILERILKKRVRYT